MKSKYVVSCSQCGLNAMCIPHTLSELEIDELDSKVRRGQPLQRGQYVFEQGVDFKSLFAIRSGSVKAFSIDDNGDEQVIGFFLPGEILGLDAIDEGRYVSTAKTLETTAVCEIPYSQISTLSSNIPNLQSHMYRLLSREIKEDQELQMLLGKKTAEERIAAFLLNLSRRYEQRNSRP
jgi:CRP/FNR family transcriptional regulator